MAKRHKDDPGAGASERRSAPRKPENSPPSRERGSERDTGRSWVHDEPPLEQNDDPQRSGYSDRETPEANNPGAPRSPPGERPAKH
jgi:hypothetical protein